ncbi:hypothetical protein PMIN03_012465 [Paraphaeosphaeria minitans]
MLSFLSRLSESPLQYHSFDLLQDGRCRVKYTKPPDGIEIPALRNIIPITTEITSPPKSKGGADERIIVISEVDGIELKKRLESEEERERWNKWAGALGESGKANLALLESFRR